MMDKEFNCSECELEFDGAETRMHQCIECSDEYCDECADELGNVCSNCGGILAPAEDEE